MQTAQIYFVADNFLMFLTALFLGDILLRGASLSLRYFAACCLFPVIILFTLLSAGLSGCLDIVSVTLLVAVELAVVSAVRLFVSGRRTATSGIPAGIFNGVADGVSCCRGVDGSARGGLAVLVIAAIGISAGLFVGRVVLSAESPYKFGCDDLTYHGNAVAHWFCQKGFGLVPYNRHAYYPLNAEVFSLWFVLPFGGDGLACLSGFYWLVVVFAACGSFCRLFGCSGWSFFLTCVLIVSSVAVKQAYPPLSAVDLAGPAMVLSSIAFVGYSVFEEGIGGRAAYRSALVFIGGLATGFAMGCKVSFAVVPVFIVLWFIFSGRGKDTLRNRFLMAGVFLAGVILTGFFWYVRNVIITGNPLFPAEFGPWPGQLTAKHLRRTELISWILARPFDLKQWMVIIQGLISWPVLVVAISFVGYVSGLYAVIKGKALPASPAMRRVISLLLLVGLGLFVFHPFMPFSGTNAGTEDPLRIELRFIIFTFLAGVVLYGRLLSREIGNKRFLQIAMVLAVIVPAGINIIGDCIFNGFILLGAGFLFLLCRFLQKIFRDLERRVVTGVLLVLFFWGSVSFCWSYQQKLHGRFIFSHKLACNAWEILDSLPDGQRIAWFGSEASQYYPLFGRRFQHEPVCIKGSGLRLPIHLEFLLPAEKDSGQDNIAGGAVLVDTLRRCRVDYVLVSRSRTGEWTKEKGYLEHAAGVCRIYSDGDAVIWKIESNLKSNF